MARCCKILIVAIVTANWAFSCAMAQRDGEDAWRRGAAEEGANRREFRERGERGRRQEWRRGRREGDGNRESRNERSDANRNTPTTDSPPPPATTATASGFGTAATGPTEASRAEGIRKWASDLIRQHDANGNMMLEADEQSALRGPSRGADLNGDGVITLDELIGHVSPKPAGSPTVVATSAAVKPATSESSEPAPQQRAAAKSYRFRSAKERLPEGLPSWFASRDTNGDGQVSMSEYSRIWTDRLAAEFQRYDRDNDGMISPEEVRTR